VTLNIFIFRHTTKNISDKHKTMVEHKCKRCQFIGVHGRCKRTASCKIHPNTTLCWQHTINYIAQHQKIKAAKPKAVKRITSKPKIVKRITSKSKIVKRITSKPKTIKRSNSNNKPKAIKKSNGKPKAARPQQVNVINLRKGEVHTLKNSKSGSSSIARWSQSKIDKANTQELLKRRQLLKKWMKGHLSIKESEKYWKVYDEFEYIGHVVNQRI
jgi:hypothetical protein